MPKVIEWLKSIEGVPLCYDCHEVRAGKVVTLPDVQADRAIAAGLAKLADSFEKSPEAAEEKGVTRG